MKLIYETDSKTVITTCYVLDENSPITRVIYNENGDWLFLGDEDIDESDTRTVSVKQILVEDKSLANLPDMQRGQIVCRRNINLSWIEAK